VALVILRFSGKVKEFREWLRTVVEVEGHFKNTLEHWKNTH